MSPANRDRPRLMDALRDLDRAMPGPVGCLVIVFAIACVIGLIWEGIKWAGRLLGADF